MQPATGLTTHKIRRRREMPEYAKYLERAKQERKEGGIKTFTTISTQLRPAPASTVARAAPFTFSVTKTSPYSAPCRPDPSIYR
ncbi:hypothetical protein QE152_g19533 [Popillia japonica]|uniref:Uncharacterized protein n=1 Tax=Popillia japonica TaxID=7064 RepID=A0AAW1KRG1_POPJA